MERCRVFNLRSISAFSFVLVLLILSVHTENNAPLTHADFPAYSDAASISAGYVPHSPIYIGSDDDFSKDWPGEGTKDKPFIIEGLHIQSNIYCIKIVGTLSYFVIRNCLLENKDAVVDGKGIEMERVSNGVVEDSIVGGMATGISLLKVQNVNISSCQIAKGKGGVRLEKVSSSSISGCVISEFDYGVYAYKIDSTTLIGNDIEIITSGIIADTCTDTKIVANVIESASSGISLYSCERLSISSNSIVNVRTNIYTKFTLNSSILHNVIQDGENGIFLDSSNRNAVSSNNISTMKSNAIYVIHSWYDNFTANDIVDNEGVGAYFYDSAYCMLYANYIGYNLRGNAYDFAGPATKSLPNNWDDGISLGNAWGGISNFDPYPITGDRGSLDRYPVPILTTGNPPDFNVEAGFASNIVWNASAVRPDYYSVEQDGFTLEEGTWNGKSIDVELPSLDPGMYKFTLRVNTTDGRRMSHSLQITSVDTTPPEWITPPADETIEQGDRVMIVIEAFDLYGISTYWINDTDHFSIDADGTLLDTEVLPLGIYPVEVRAYDPSMNFIFTEIVITVEDTIIPEIDGPTDFAYDEGVTGNSISWSISDRNPYSYQVYLNGDLIETADWTLPIHVIEVSVDGLSPGTHIYRLELLDIAGNRASDEVTVIVNPKPSETTTETTTSGTTETTSISPPTSTPPPTEPTVANGTLLITGIAGVAVLGAGAIILMMRKRR
ncbi:MAG: nitrous oxide reductase family maturation protein NosD [Promethearchaeota archaeon]